MKNLALLVLSIAIFTGCAQKVNVVAFEPAQVHRASQTKKISILAFEKDDIGFASTLETTLAQKQVFGENYFTVISRNKIDEILAEQKLQYSGLVDNKTQVKIGKLIGAQALISGSVIDSSLNRSYFRETRVRCGDEKCKRVIEYTVPCTKGIYNLGVNIKMTDIELGDIIYADTLTNTVSYSYCTDQSRGLPNFASVMNDLTTEMVNDFASKISPTKRYLSVELLEDPEIDYTDKDEQLLEYSLEYIKASRYDKAEQLLSELLNNTNDKCFVAAYNLGVVKELKGQYKLAKQLYDLADSLVLEPNEIINLAVNRINTQLSNQKIVKEQVEK